MNLTSNIRGILMKNKTLHFLSLGLALGVCLSALSAVAQEIEVYDNASEPTPVDFPGRSSLAEPKEAPLPSLSDNIIKDPAPMERAMSKKDLPSEQLLGRITSEVFHEMADLERGNVFLKLQAQREQLKNDVEALKAKYREARLAEIEKRENIIRTRVKWQQEQEQTRQEIAEKKLKTELLEKQLEETEITKENLLKEARLREEALAREAEAEEVEEGEDDNQQPADEKVKKEKPKKQPVFGIRKIIDVKGMKGRLTARAIDTNGKNLILRVGTVLPSGHVVKTITKTDIALEKDGSTKVYNIEELAKAYAEKEAAEAEDEEDDEVED